MGEPDRRHSTALQIEEDDEHRLADLGYKQELQRDWSVMHNFGVSFSIISVVTGITTLFGYAGRVFMNRALLTNIEAMDSIQEGQV
jgi:hypothetical protein